MKRIVLLLAALLVSFAALALEPVVDYENVPVKTGSGKAASMEAVGVAISNATKSGKRQWMVKRMSPEKLRAIYNAGRHAVAVDIDYSDKAYSIHYFASDNMKYGVSNGERTIHPYYNKWVEELKGGISAELSKL